MAAERDNKQGHAFVFNGRSFNFNKDTYFPKYKAESFPTDDEIFESATAEPTSKTYARIAVIEKNLAKMHKRKK